MLKVNTVLLKHKIKSCNTTQEGLSNSIGIDKSTFYRKIKANGKNFTVNEIYKMIKSLGLNQEEVINIFFAA